MKFFTNLLLLAVSVSALSIQGENLERSHNVELNARAPKGGGGGKGGGSAGKGGGTSSGGTSSGTRLAKGFYLRFSGKRSSLAFGRDSVMPVFRRDGFPLERASGIKSSSGASPSSSRSSSSGSSRSDSSSSSSSSWSRSDSLGLVG